MLLTSGRFQHCTIDFQEVLVQSWNLLEINNAILLGMSSQILEPPRNEQCNPRTSWKVAVQSCSFPGGSRVAVLESKRFQDDTVNFHQIPGLHIPTKISFRLGSRSTKAWCVANWSPKRGVIKKATQHLLSGKESKKLPPFLSQHGPGSGSGQKCGNTGSSCLDKPVLPHSTHHRAHVADISEPYHSKHMAIWSLLNHVQTKPVLNVALSPPSCIRRGGGGVP